MTTTSTSLLQTALQNLKVSQQVHQPSHTPRPPSSPGDNESSSSKGASSASSEEDDEEGELVRVGQGTRPGTPLPGQKGLVLGQKVPSGLVGKAKDPVGLGYRR